MKNGWMIAGIILIGAGCTNRSESEFTTVSVREVRQVDNYSYMRVKGKGPEYWIAVPAMEAQPGETYYYQGGMRMTDFTSETLGRTFDEILFLEALYAGRPPSSGEEMEEDMTPGSMASAQRSDTRVEPGEGALSVAEIYADAGSYEGETVRVTGEVVRYNPDIMERNWVHIQDGTEHEGKFDLTATSEENFRVGEVVTIEGTLALNRDFGYGYSYDLLLENARAVR